MNDFRALINDRPFITTFIVGNRYVTVFHLNRTLPDIIQAIEEYLEDDFKKPFVIVSQTYVYYEDAMVLVDKDVIDIVLE